MVLETIYVTRHGFRSNWVVDPATGTYYSNLPTPTGIPSDPSLAAHGVGQSKELAAHIVNLDPPVDVIYSSPFYRCLQTLAPTVEALNAERTSDDDKVLVHVENGLGEFYGLARFDHPSPATLDVLHDHFPNHLDRSYTTPLIRPSVNGESLEALHDRIAYALHHVIKTLDADPKGPKSLLICTHAASMICIGRALTGRMPEDMGEDDFRCFTCALSKFTRRSKPEPSSTNQDGKADGEQVWDPEAPETIPDVDWKDGKGVQGGWDCVVNGDCSFLSKGEERGWHWHMEPGLEYLQGKLMISEVDLPPMTTSPQSIAELVALETADQNGSVTAIMQTPTFIADDASTAICAPVAASTEVVPPDLPLSSTSSGEEDEGHVTKKPRMQSPIKGSETAAPEMPSLDKKDDAVRDGESSEEE